MYFTASDLSREEINLVQTKDSEVCISILIPTSYDQPGKSLSQKLEQSFQKAVPQLEQSYQEKKESLEIKFQELLKNLTLESLHQAIGIFISQTIEYVVQFPFPVEEKVIIDNHFHLREILFKINYSNPYYLLLLDGKQALLYTALFDELQKIQDSNFPKKIIDDYIYQHPSTSHYYFGNAETSSFLKDKSTPQKNHYLSFLMQVDDSLDIFLSGKASQLIICGVKSVTASFLNHSKHDAMVAGVLTGNYSHLSETELSVRVQPLIQAAQYESMLEDISELEEKIGEGLADEGLYDVWQSVIDGRGKVLLIEKDYEDKVYIESDYPFDIQMRPTRRACCVVHNPVDKLIAIHLNKKGRIVILANGMLSQHKQIALIRRY